MYKTPGRYINVTILNNNYNLTTRKQHFWNEWTITSLGVKIWSNVQAL